MGWKGPFHDGSGAAYTRIRPRSVTGSEVSCTKQPSGREAGTWKPPFQAIAVTTDDDKARQIQHMTRQSISHLGERNMTDRKPISLLRQPGALRSQTSLEIQTRQAQRLVYGRRAEGGKPAIFGLLRFGTMLRPIWEGAATDDPWADWCLVQIERELLEAREAMESLMAQVQTQLKSRPAMDVAVAQSVEPVKVDLTFTSPYAFMGAYLLADYDVLARAILTGRHIGLFDRDTSERMLREGGRIVRRAFNTAQGYKYLGVCREDLRQGTQKAGRATDMLGALPQPVIDGTLRAAHAPDIRPAANSPATPLDDDDNLALEDPQAAESVQIGSEAG